MSKIAIVTDSTANLHTAMVQQLEIEVLPLKIHWGGETYLDGVDMTPKEFYHRLAHDPVLPTTSQPSSHDFLKAFEKQSGGAQGIVAPLISSGISGTVGTAQGAAAEFTKLPVEIVDTHLTSAGLALVVLAAARASQGGASFEEVVATARTTAQKVQIYFVLDTFEFLHKGGRIGGATRYLGTMLSIKPILTFDTGGKITGFERVRTKRKALDRLVALVKEQVGGKPAHVGVLHAEIPETAAELYGYFSEHLDCKEIHTFELSPVIGIHVGPGAIGVAFYTE